jgi:hypothetical protein
MTALLLSTTAAAGPQEQESGPADQSITSGALPSLHNVYAIETGAARGFHVAFTQLSDVLSARWIGPDGIAYARGKYVWEPSSGSFNGLTVLRTSCTGGDDPFEVKTIDVVVREQIYAIGPSELRIRWTKPLSIDCVTGEVRFFKWSEAHWRVPVLASGSAPE